jgi:transcriptional regulator with XRE-family HTH domain
MSRPCTAGANAGLRRFCVGNLLTRGPAQALPVYPSPTHDMIGEANPPQRGRSDPSFSSVRIKLLASLGELTYHANMSSNPQDIGPRIRIAREDRGWTQDQLAAAVGVSRSAVAQWETGRAGQVTTNLTRIASELGVGVEQLMYGHGKAAPGQVQRGDELAIIRLYRDCAPEDRQLLLRTARRLAKTTRRR